MLTNIDEKIKKIDPSKYYTIKDIVDNGWILNRKGEEAKTRYDFIYKAIRKGALPARDVSLTKGKGNHQYLVRGLDIIDFMKIYQVR